MPNDMPSADGLSAAIDALIRELNRAFDPTSGPDKDPSFRRVRYTCALTAVANFLDRVPTAHDFAQEFVTLAAALNDLNQGSVHSLLMPPKIENRPPDSTEIWMERAKVAIAVEMLMRTGMTRINVKKMLDAKFAALIGLASRGESASGAAMAWHNEFMKEKAKNQVAADFVRKILARVDTIRSESLAAEVRAEAIRLLGTVVHGLR